MSAIWTCVGSTFVPDERSASRYEASAARFRHRGSNTGNILARANITNPRDNGASPPWNAMEVIYFRQHDDSRVLVKLIRVSNSTGGTWTVDTFDSNDHGTSSSAQAHIEWFSHSFNFIRYAYFVEATVSRSDSSAGNNPALCIVRLVEAPM